MGLFVVGGDGAEKGGVGGSVFEGDATGSWAYDTDAKTTEDIGGLPGHAAGECEPSCKRNMKIFKCNSIILRNVEM